MHRHGLALGAMLLSLSLLAAQAQAEQKLSFAQKVKNAFSKPQVTATVMNLRTKLHVGAKLNGFEHKKSWVANGVLMSSYANKSNGATMKVVQGKSTARKTTITYNNDNIKKAKKTEWEGKYGTKFTAVKQTNRNGEVTTLRKAEGKNGGAYALAKKSNGDSLMKKIWNLGATQITHKTAVIDGKKTVTRTGQKAL